MIRLPPSAISLGALDIKDFEKRQKRRKTAEVAENIHQQFARFEIGAQDGPSFGCPKINFDYLHNFDGQYGSLTDQVADCHISTAEDIVQKDSGMTITPCRFEVVSSSGLGLSPENVIVEIQQPSSSPKNDFHYGGFIESPRHPESPARSSPFAPDDASTPQPLQPANIPTLRPRLIPRSPLFHAQSASSSPERLLTSSLTPRVASRVATHRTPGIIFAQPARRRARFRHQTNSFSFDESERSSAVYEQDRVSSNSTTDSRPHQLDEPNLREELRGSSLQSSTTSSGISSSPPTPEENETTSLHSNEDRRREFIFSSPDLPLPPPFSAIPRNLSRAESLPSVEYELSNPATSPVRSASSSPIHSRSTPISLKQPVSHAAGEGDDGISSSPPFGGSSTRKKMLRSAIRLLSPYRNRSPLGSFASPPPDGHSTSPSSSPTPRQSKNERTRQSEAQTPSRQYQVYNDSRSPASQPQTPAQLPEARHQSRFHPSYTAPITRAGRRARIDSIHYGDGTTIDVPRVRNISVTPTRRPTVRSGSPVGLLGSDGFRGLYGGRENGNEEQDWIDGVRSTNGVWRGLRESHGG